MGNVATAPVSVRLCVSTQVLEVSLHISGAILHTNGAPLEPLWRRFGCINRSGF